MISSGATLGGEGSGHIICLDKCTTGDGIISALQVLEVISSTNKNLNQLKSEMQKFPQVMINIRTSEKLDLASHKELTKIRKHVEDDLGEDGRVLIRVSGTEPVVRVMVEGKDLALVQSSAEKLAATLR
jgi:phosphoglucosamine mutase